MSDNIGYDANTRTLFAFGESRFIEDIGTAEWLRTLQQNGNHADMAAYSAVLQQRGGQECTCQNFLDGYQPMHHQTRDEATRYILERAGVRTTEHDVMLSLMDPDLMIERAESVLRLKVLDNHSVINVM